MKILDELRKQIEDGKQQFSAREVQRLIVEVERKAEFQKKHSIQLCLAKILGILSTEQRERLMLGVLGGSKKPLPSYQGDWMYTVDLGTGLYSFYTITPGSGWAWGPAHPDCDINADEAVSDE